MLHSYGHTLIYHLSFLDINSVKIHGSQKSYSHSVILCVTNSLVVKTAIGLAVCKYTYLRFRATPGPSARCIASGNELRPT